MKMSLRDRFACAAMAAMLPKFFEVGENDDPTIDECSMIDVGYHAYEIAHRMMIARSIAIQNREDELWEAGEKSQKCPDQPEHEKGPL